MAATTATATSAATTATLPPASSQLWIISKAGGLIYQSAPPSGPTPPAFNSVSSNEALILAGTLHGIHAITARLDPTRNGKSKGAVESLEAERFGMAVKATVTGVKFVLLHPSTHPSPQQTLQRCYQAYADQVMKNPFYTAEMPIRVSGFDREVATVLAA
ncbi:unnamed protein product [Sympodiomycopsis kandeliae]